MDVNEPGLFDLPDRETSVAPEASRRGRNRETWARTVTAEVTIIDLGALQEAAARVEDEAVMIPLHTDSDVESVEPEAADVGSVEDPIDTLVGLIWPTDGMGRLMDSGAVRILWVESEVVTGSVAGGTVSWTVMAKLTSVGELRRFASEAHPEEAESIADSLAVAWRLAADPFEPLRSIPGITWRPRQIDVEHVPAMAVWNAETAAMSLSHDCWRPSQGDRG